MSKHTPGPWVVQGRSIHHLLYQEPLDQRNEIARVPNDNPESIQNARLIAAAPRMVAFIQAGYCDDDEAAAILQQIGVEP